jgi:hypothetical protein
MISGDDLDLFEASLRRATESCTGAALDAALDDIGWADALAEDRHAAVSLLFTLQGRSGATSSALDRLLSDALGVGPGAAVVVPALGQVTPPGRASAGRVEVHGLVAPPREERGQIGVVIGDAMVRLARREVTLRSVSGMDPSLGLVEVDGEYAAGDRVDLSPDAWTDAVAISQLALSHELIGAARAVLALARDHAVERIQFDQPIARFQAVRHRLADTYVAIESADAAVDAAWDDGSALAAAIAKAVAGRNARLAARHCQQVLAGIGFTAEHSFHGYLRRVLVLERLFGDARALTVAVGEELLRTRQVPPLLPL